MYKSLFILAMCLLMMRSAAQETTDQKIVPPSFKGGKGAFHDSLMRNIFIRPHKHINTAYPVWLLSVSLLMQMAA